MVLDSTLLSGLTQLDIRDSIHALLGKVSRLSFLRWTLSFSPFILEIILGTVRTDYKQITFHRLNAFDFHGPATFNCKHKTAVCSEQSVVYSVRLLFLIEENAKESSGGLAFEVILKPATVDSPQIVKNGTPFKEISHEFIEKKLKEAKERRLVSCNNALCIPNNQPLGVLYENMKAFFTESTLLRFKSLYYDSIFSIFYN
jgi:hypothetical protein